MKQTVTINISGIVYHIEVDAYEVLKNYLQKIKSYFNNSIECEEIMQDIESRIAELFNELITEKNQVITAQNVTDIMGIMGKPEQYITDEDEEVSQSHTEQNKGSEKKLFRNTDERILGGVGSGLAAYIGVDTVWVRLFFVAAFFMGFGFLMYIILWIVIPAAKTASDKLKMKGEPINFKNIGKKIEDEASQVNEKLKKIDATSFFAKLGVVVERIALGIASFFTSLFTVLGKIIGVGLLIIGTSALFIFIFALFSSSSIISISSSGTVLVETFDLLSLIFKTEDDFFIGLIGIILTVGIPLVAIILLSIKILFKIKSHYSVGLSLIGLFVLGIIFCSWSGTRTAKEFSSKKYSVKNTSLPTNSSTLTINAFADEIPGKVLIAEENIEISVTEDALFMHSVRFSIKKSNSDSIYIEEKYVASGSDQKTALSNTKSIRYKHHITDSTLALSTYFSIPKEIKLRNQHVYITLYLPLNKSIFLDETVRNLLYDVDNVSNTNDKKMTNKKWIMLEQGLTCVDCENNEGITQLQADSIQKFVIKVDD